MKVEKVSFDDMSALVDVARPVKVYRNLRDKCWSVVQDGIVKIRTTYLCLQDVTFKVSQAGRKRVIETKRKNVHAFAVGKLISATVINSNTTDGTYIGVTYNPYKFDSFVVADNTGVKVAGAKYADFSLMGPFVNESNAVMAWDVRSQ